MTVGFIGLGLMGNPMSKNVLKHKFPLVVYNRTPGKSEEIKKLGATVAASPKELASQCDVIITIVTDAKSVEDVLFGDNGVVASGKKDLIVIDMSTIGPSAVTKIVEKLTPFGISFIDAPVTGSTPKAISGELTIFAGGKKEVFEKIKPVLSAMGTNIQYMGDSGSGQAVKLLNNFLIASHNEAIAESMLLADMMGLSREKAAEALVSTPTLSENGKMKIKNYVTETYPLLFSLSNMRKDLGLAISEMKKGKGNLPILQKIEELFGKANEQAENSSLDFTIIMNQVKTENSYS
jgi:3-hydroxyisobutyrate dehydrogenase